MKVTQKYTPTLNIVKENIILDILKTCWSTKPSNLWWQKQFQEKSTYLEDSASGMQVGDIEQGIV